MALFKKKNIEKESNIASAPEHKKTPSTFSVKKFYLSLWNTISFGLYIVYVFYLILRVEEISFLYDIIVYAFYGYGIALALIFLLSIGKKSKLKTRLKNYKSAVKFLQYTIQLVSFVLLIITALSSLFTTGKLDVLALTNALYSLIVTIVMVIFEIIKIMIRKNIPVVKENFLRLREEDTIYKKIDSGIKKLRHKKSEDVDSDNYNQNEDNLNQKDENLSIAENPSGNNLKTTIAETNETEQTEPKQEEPVLGKNEKYDKDAGVIISYDDDEIDDDENEYDKFDEVFYDNHLISRDSTKGPSRNRLAGLFNKLKKK